MRLPSSPVSLAAIALLVAACSGAAAPASSLGPGASPPSASGAIVVTSPEAAAALVIGQDPRFAGFQPPDRDAIGQCCWYEATAVEGGYQVVIRVGWGDCPSGCIDEHRWTYAVSPDGQVGLINETGEPVPPNVLPSGGTGG